MSTENYTDEVKHVLSSFLNTPVQDNVIEQYIQTWQTNKNKFLRVFQGPIYTYPISIECSVDNQQTTTQINKLIKNILRGKYADTAFTFGVKAFTEFLQAQDLSVAKNLVAVNWTCPDGTEIPVGMKLLRTFKYFINDKDILNKVQDDVNLIISNCKLAGYLHFSVHPLDYLSISENGNGWRSCHSLDGDYAAGNLEYMMDKATVVCYLDDNTKVNINNFPYSLPWNNKKWRVLLFFSEDNCTIFAGRQYPNVANGLLSEIRKCITEIFKENKYDEQWDNIYCDDVNVATNENRRLSIRERHLLSVYDSNIYPLTSIYEPVEDSSNGHLFYDDIMTSNIYKYPYYLLGSPKFHYSTITYKRWHHVVKPGISTGVSCPCCGEHTLIRGEGWECERYSVEQYICECCGRRHLRSDEGGWIDESWWCDNCINENAAYCSRCGGLFNMEDMAYHEDEGYVCMECLRTEE